jgi:EPSP synthase (3-phosphoshikimate 1-carboxyvinyltransferase)
LPRPGSPWPHRNGHLHLSVKSVQYRHLPVNRKAMSFAVAGLVSNAPITVDDMEPVNTCFPGFVEMLEKLRRGVI